MSLADELQKLQALREQGALNDEEFALAKKRLLEAETASFSEPKTQVPPTLPNRPSALRNFHRSRTDRWIGGVCGGLSAVTDIPAWSWRILFVLLALLHGLGIAVYVLLWIFVPLEPLALPAPVAPAAPSPPPATPSDHA